MKWYTFSLFHSFSKWFDEEWGERERDRDRDGDRDRGSVSEYIEANSENRKGRSIYLFSV